MAKKTKSKTKVLFITGDDFAAMIVDQEIGIEKAAKIVEKGGDLANSLGEDYTDFSIDAKILEFGDIDSKFVDFVKNEIADYDISKTTDFFIVGD